MKIKDSKGFIGLFYFIYGDIYTYVEDYDSNKVDYLGKIQPFYSHESLLSIVKNNQNLQDLLGYDLRVASYDTFPRGRVCYDFYNQRFIVSTCQEIIDDEEKKNKIKEAFELYGKKVLFRTEMEYEDFENEYL